MLSDALSLMNRRFAKTVWPFTSNVMLANLDEYSTEYGFSLRKGDLLMLDHGWYVTHTGLLRLAQRKSCAGIQVSLIAECCDPSAGRWVFQAIAFPNRTSKGFSGYGDADPSNVSPAMRGAELRIAETRAVNRALRKAYGIGVCSIEEIGSAPRPEPPAKLLQLPVLQASDNGNGHRLRDQICLLIRKHKLDAGLQQRAITFSRRIFIFVGMQRLPHRISAGGLNGHDVSGFHVIDLFQMLREHLEELRVDERATDGFHRKNFDEVNPSDARVPADLQHESQRLLRICRNDGRWKQLVDSIEKLPHADVLQCRTHENRNAVSRRESRAGSGQQARGVDLAAL